MVFGLGKLFGKKEDAAPAASTAEVPVANEEAARSLSAFLRRDAVFDRHRKLVGHVIRLQHVDAGLGNASKDRQISLDDTLLRSLTACVQHGCWSKQPVFIPISSLSLRHPSLRDVPPENTTLLVYLAAESDDGVEVADGMSELSRHGYRLGLFRQPKHPAFASALMFSDFAAIDVADSQGGSIRDFSVALRSDEVMNAMRLIALNIESHDDFRLCLQCRFDFFHGPFAANKEKVDDGASDPHKLHLLHLFNLVQSDADTAKIADALKQDPMLTFRIMRYLNSAAVGLTRPLATIDQALVMLGRQRLARWLSVLLFSVRDPDFTDWLLVESALARGRMLELLGAERFPAAEADHLFITGVFSRLDRLLRAPLETALAELPLPTNVRNAILENTGPYAPLLAVVDASETANVATLDELIGPTGLDPDQINRALIAATTWANDITEHWE